MKTEHFNEKCAFMDVMKVVKGKVERYLSEAMLSTFK